MVARLRILDTPVAIETSGFNRPRVWFDEFGSPLTDDHVRFDVSALGSNTLAQSAGCQVKIELSEGKAILKLRGTFSPVPLQGGEVLFRWDACQWFESGVEKLYVDKRGTSRLALRINGEDRSKGRAWALGLSAPEPVFGLD